MAGRRDRLTYDVAAPARRPVPPRPVLLLAVVLALAVGLVVWTLTSPGPEPARPGTAAPGSTGTPSPVSTPSPGGAPPSPGPVGGSATPVPSGGDAGEGLPAPEGSREAAARFVTAWLDPDPASRQLGLAEVAAPGLAEALMLTDPGQIPATTARGVPVLDAASAYSVEYRQVLGSGLVIRVYLVADPAARYGWLVTSVEQA